MVVGLNFGKIGKWEKEPQRKSFLDYMGSQYSNKMISEFGLRNDFGNP